MAATLEPRRARLELIYRGVDIAEHCESAEYVDFAESQVDELRCTLEDRELRWQGPWFPGKGEEVRAYIRCFDWDGPGDAPRLDCGLMEIGEVTLSGPPDMVEITAASARVKSTARVQKKTKAWEDKALSHIAAHVAEKCGLGLHWEGLDHHFERVDQREESDLGFLTRLAREHGNSVKTAHEKLIVYAGQKYDQRGPHGELVRGHSDIIGYRFATTSHDLYKGAVVSYWRPELKEHIVGEFWPDPAPASQDVLRVNQPVKDAAEAAKLAQTSLRRKNKVEVTAEITLKGAPFRRATEVVRMSGFGRFDGRYFVAEARHGLSGGGVYQTTLSLRQVIAY